MNTIMLCPLTDPENRKRGRKMEQSQQAELSFFFFHWKIYLGVYSITECISKMTALMGAVRVIVLVYLALRDFEVLVLKDLL